MRINNRTIGTTIAAIILGPKGSRVEVADANVSDGDWSFSEATVSVNVSEFDSPEDCDVAVSVTFISDGGEFDGTSPDNTKVCESSRSQEAEGTVCTIMLISGSFRIYELMLNKNGKPLVAFKSPIGALNIAVVMFMKTVTLAMSPYISVADTVTFEGMASDGTVPLSSKVELSKFNQDGICVVIEVRLERFATCPSSSSLFERPLKLISTPVVVFMAELSYVKANRWIPTSMPNDIELPAKPSTSEAINLTPKVCGGCMREA
jgi:hypothetical protein